MNTFIQIVFLVISTIILGAALMAVSARNLIHAALWLISSFFGVGALYLLMQAEFAAIIQVLVYVGAIAILILFAIMLTPDVSGEGETPIFRNPAIALVISAGLFGLVLVPMVWQSEFLLGDQSRPIVSATEIGISFMREYLLPFELASVLLLIALVGAIVIGLDDGSRRRVLTLAEEWRLRRHAAEPSKSTEEAQSE